ncbi:tetratricopeptide repeat protein [Parathalassolituus penaei]|uniref:Tetratricopeptide repeat protein n=1 Tax=Parathalassolituus penaei TaxID=2997323 RepID=A0A9X3EF48_9GAMM|nr:tetratricopeptide repeat protein [Parathalassolituus penaei]MCY0965614.1 tetratricopeptide repeat protein [Parathalassolituus penaei]
MSVKFASFLMAALLLTGCASSPSRQDSLETTQAAPTDQTVTTKTDANLDPQMQGFYKHGLGLLKSGKYQPALTHWQQMSEKYPDYPGIWVNLALSQYHLNKYEDAQSSLAKARALNSEFCPIFGVEGLVDREQGQFRKAEIAYKNAIACNGQDADLHRNLGILYDLYLRDYAHAVEQYRIAQSLSKPADANLTIWIQDLETRYGLASSSSTAGTAPASESPAETPAATAEEAVTTEASTEDSPE